MGATRRVMLILACLGILGCASGPSKTPLPKSTAHVPQDDFVISSAAVSPDGRRIAVAAWSPSGGFGRLWLVTGAGELRPLTGERTDDPRSPSWAADGQRVVFEVLSDNGSAIKLFECDRGHIKDLVYPTTDWFYFFPQWSPDGQSVAYGAARVGSGALSIWVASAEGDSAPRQIVAGDGVLHIDIASLAWSTEGDRVYYYSPEHRELRVVHISSGHSQTISHLPTNTLSSVHIFPSPDGTRLLCTNSTADEGAESIWVAPAGAGEPKALANFGCWPTAAWSPDSKRVVVGSAAPYSDEDGLVMLDVETGEGRWLTGRGHQDRVASGNAWTSQGEILFIRDRIKVMSVRQDGTEEKVMLSVADLPRL